MTQQHIVGLMGTVFEVAACILMLAIALAPARTLAVLFGTRAVSGSSAERIQFIRAVAAIVFLGTLVSICDDIRKLIQR